jgi:hypothetical protein
MLTDPFPSTEPTFAPASRQRWIFISTTRRMR